MRACRIAIAAVFLTVASQTALAATLDVPAQWPTIQSAVDAAVDGDVVAIAPGLYQERVVVNRSITLCGTGAHRTDVVISNAANWFDDTFDSITLWVRADEVEVCNLVVRNTFDESTTTPAHAIAARFDKRAYVENSVFDGGSDALNITGDVFFNTVKVRGTNDCVWGSGSAVFVNSVFVAENSGAVFAQGSTSVASSSFNVYRSRFLAEDGVRRVRLARPWQTHSTVRIMESTVGNNPHAKRYSNSWSDGREQTLSFVECGNQGVPIGGEAILVTPCVAVGAP